MSTRLQVVLDEAELAEIRAAARRHRMTVSAWVRHVLREARKDEPARSAERKLTVIREAAAHSYPTGTIEDMLGEP